MKRSQWPESVPYKKKDRRGRGHTRPSFGMTPTFQKKKSLKSWCHTKRRTGAAMHTCPSFGMTTPGH